MRITARVIETAAPGNPAGLGHWLASSLPSCLKLGSIPATRSTPIPAPTECPRAASALQCAPMRLAIALLLCIPGLILLATPGLPAGLLLCWAAWWVYERSGLPDRDGLATLTMTLGALGAAAVICQFIGERLGWL